jgi:hypothetical protein
MSDREPGDLADDGPSTPGAAPGPVVPGGGTSEQPRRRRWLRRTLLSVGVLGLVLALVVGGGL